MNVQVGRFTFDRFVYDEGADVLYLSVGEPSAAAHSYATPEGHAVRSDESGNIIGITFVNAKWLLDRNGELEITLRNPVAVSEDQIRPALAAAR